MDPHFYLAALQLVHLMVNSTQSACSKGAGQRSAAVIKSLQGIAYFLFVISVSFEQAIVVAMTTIVVVKEVYSMCLIDQDNALRR